jgi:hypothetical protein
LFFFVADFNIQDAGGKDRQGMLQKKSIKMFEFFLNIGLFNEILISILGGKCHHRNP